MSLRYKEAKMKKCPEKNVKLFFSKVLTFWCSDHDVTAVNSLKHSFNETPSNEIKQSLNMIRVDPLTLSIFSTTLEGFFHLISDV